MTRLDAQHGAIGRAPLDIVRAALMRLGVHTFDNVPVVLVRRWPTFGDPARCRGPLPLSFA